MTTKTTTVTSKEINQFILEQNTSYHGQGTQIQMTSNTPVSFLQLKQIMRYFKKYYISFLLHFE